MITDKIQLYEEQPIRTEEWYFSITDVANTKQPRRTL